MKQINETNLHKILCAENTKSFIFTRQEILDFLFDATSDAYVAGFKTGFDYGRVDATCDIACDIFKASVMTGAI